ncbi:MAG: arsenate reductase ArsC [Candidatus Marinimicrobia bacterium]|jgi:arsenate reductase (thioredoxin)|nr:arsenate reductase ArsC [Candidatus Neomarinimicrobiota bacterium]MBT4361095.1 arsenate reductase ArsC [Candidatus Neomarinimicrobiota bacterium]MBT4713517.1 arsenate reductase ArsC [Candidatus Neomarinimicrobiota bacterium]MBT4946671.1 arsenate reductase ArsC [Candidatus Neomarinimicrobiota bacterium]MBT5268666.1 arsenate reductase ArsC [Candidatus Neomarinimicrobiota bacterium]
MKQKILFLCTGNSCRSQIGEGLMRHLAGDKYEVFSAGVEPSRLHPMSILVMQEIGVDIGHQTSDDVNDYLDSGINIIISVCDHAAQTCPTFPGDVQRVHWSLKDPFHGWDVDESKLPDYRKTRDDLKQRIQGFLSNQA